jgi:hypothetical protein
MTVLMFITMVMNSSVAAGVAATGCTHTIRLFCKDDIDLGNYQ